MGFTRAELESYRDATVPDLVGPGLRLLFVGINPGLWTAADGDALRPPRQPLLPGAAAGGRDRPGHRPRRRDDRRRPARYLIDRGIGITNIVARATATGRRRSRRPSCTPAASGCCAFVAEHRPVVVAVAGITAYPPGVRPPATPSLGRQPEPFAGAELWIVPNPSGLNAHETIDTPGRRLPRARRRRRHRRPDAASGACTRRSSAASATSSDRNRPRAASGQGRRSASARLARYQSIVARRPSSNGIRARHPRTCSARLASTRRRGWPSGFVGSHRSSPVKPTSAGDRLDRLADRDLVVGAEVDRLGDRARARRRPRRRGRSPRRRRRRTGTRGWPGRCPTPRPCPRRARGLDALLDQRRDDVRHVGVELVAGPVQVGRDQVGEALAVLRGVDLGVDEVGLLGQAVRRVGLLRVAVPEALLAERHRRELRVRAHRADEHGRARRPARCGRPR